MSNEQFAGAVAGAGAGAGAALLRVRRGTDLQLLHLGGPDAGPSQLANQRPADDGVDSWGTTTRKVNTGRSHSTVSGALSGALSQERSQEHCLRSALRSTVSHYLRSTVSGALSQEHYLMSTLRETRAMPKLSAQGAGSNRVLA